MYDVCSSLVKIYWEQFVEEGLKLCMIVFTSHLKLLGYQYFSSFLIFVWGILQLRHTAIQICECFVPVL